MGESCDEVKWIECLFVCLFVCVWMEGRADRCECEIEEIFEKNGKFLKTQKCVE